MTGFHSYNIRISIQGTSQLGIFNVFVKISIGHSNRFNIKCSLQYLQNYLCDHGKFSR